MVWKREKSRKQQQPMNRSCDFTGLVLSICHHGKPWETFTFNQLPHYDETSPQTNDKRLKICWNQHYLLSNIKSYHFMTQVQNWCHQSIRKNTIDQNHGKSHRRKTWTLQEWQECIMRHLHRKINKSNIWYSEREKLLPGWISWKKNIFHHYFQWWFPLASYLSSILMHQSKKMQYF